MSRVRARDDDSAEGSHGYLESRQELFWNGSEAVYRRSGGFARIATLLEEIRGASPGQVLALDCRDIFHGTYAAVQIRGQAKRSIS